MKLNQPSKQPRSIIKNYAGECFVFDWVSKSVRRKNQGNQSIKKFDWFLILDVDIWNEFDIILSMMWVDYLTWIKKSRSLK